MTDKLPILEFVSRYWKAPEAWEVLRPMCVPNHYDMSGTQTHTVLTPSKHALAAVSL